MRLAHVFHEPSSTMGIVVRRRWPLVLLALFVVAFPWAQANGAPSPQRMTVFWAIGCPHCEEARPAVRSLGAERPGLDVEWVEVRHDPNGRARFIETAKRLGVEGAGVPMFVIGDRAVVGFRAGFTEHELRRAIDDGRGGTAS